MQRASVSNSSNPAVRDQSVSNTASGRSRSSGKIASSEKRALRLSEKLETDAEGPGNGIPALDRIASVEDREPSAVKPGVHPGERGGKRFTGGMAFVQRAVHELQEQRPFAQAAAQTSRRQASSPSGRPKLRS